MGKEYIDQFTILHLATGIVAYFWGFTFWGFFAVHSIFEYIENTGVIMKIINKYIKIWPGGKSHRDTFTNSVMDTVAAMLGWIIASTLDNMVEKNEITIRGIINSRHKKLLNFNN